MFNLKIKEDTENHFYAVEILPFRNEKPDIPSKRIVKLLKN